MMKVIMQNNYIKILVLTALSWILSVSAYAQNRTISGKINDAKNGEPIVGATIFLTPSNKGTVTNEIGYFSIIVPENSEDKMVIRCIGYETLTLSTKGLSSSMMNIELPPLSITTEEVVVKGEHRVMNIQNAQVGAHSISPKEIEYLPSLGGERDVIKALQMLPGVTGGDEGSSSLVVRGGSPDQNLFLIDQVPVYNASHVMGLFSVFTPEAISHVDFYKAGFPANYGGRLSSVVDISMKEGNRNHLTGDITIGTISSKGLIEGPINKGKGSFIITARRTYLDVLAAPFLKAKAKTTEREDDAEVTSKNDLKSYFYDITGKLTYQITPKTKAFLSLYKGKDLFGGGFKDDTKYDNGNVGKSDFSADIQWGNFTSSLRLNHIHNSRLYSNITAYTSMYNYSTDLKMYEYMKKVGVDKPSENRINNSYISKVSDIGLKYDSHFNISPSNRLVWGLSGIYHHFTPGETVQNKSGNAYSNEIRTGAKQVSTKEGAAFAHWEFDPFARWKVDMGLRYSFYQTDEVSFQQLEPRFSVRFLVSDQMSLKASYALMQQPVHLLAQNNFALGTSIWVPATKRIHPGQSQQVSLGAMLNVSDALTFSVEGWAKKLDDQVEFRYGTFDSAENWENEVTTGIGRAYGVDFLLRKQKGKTTGWISYTWSKNERKFDELNNGKWYPYRYDRTHDMKIVVQHKFSKKISLGANYLLSSGYPITIPTSYYSSNSNSSNLFYSPKTLYIPELNNKRMKMYHRLDCSLSFHKEKKRGTRTWSLGVYNAYGRKNAYNYITEQSTGDKGETKIKISELSLFRFIPSVTYRFNFK